MKYNIFLVIAVFSLNISTSSAQASELLDAAKNGDLETIEFFNNRGCRREYCR